MEILNKVKWWAMRNVLAKNHRMPKAVKKDKEDPRRYMAGTLKKDVLRENGDYSDIVSSPSWVNLKQNQFGLETMGCTGHGLLNTIRIIAKVKYGLDWVLSPRYQNKTAGTGPRGNSMITQLDNLRKVAGCVDYNDWPWTPNINTWEEYYSSIPAAIMKKGHDWIKQWTVNYEFVPMKKEAIKEALKYGPLYVSGFAWSFYNGYYRSWGSANHCFDAVLVDIDKEGAYIVHDSYEPFVKKLAPDYMFGAIYTVVLTKNTQYNLDYISSLMKRGLQYVLLVSPYKDYQPGVYKISADGITQEDVIKEINDEGVKSFSAKGILTGISANNFEKMIISK